MATPEEGSLLGRLSLLLLSALLPAKALACDPAALPAGAGPQFVAPISRVEAVLGDGFGMRLHPLLKLHRMHAGQDWQAATATPVLAAGEVVFAERDGASDNTIAIDHGAGYRTCYSHLSRIFVARGDCVTSGQRIGGVGSTGLAVGPHLHFEIHHDRLPIDPLLLLRP